jgi:hypothetical protein
MNLSMTPLSSKCFILQNMILWGKVMFHSCRGNTKVEADSRSETLAEFQPDRPPHVIFPVPSDFNHQHPQHRWSSAATSRASYSERVSTSHFSTSSPCPSRQTRIHPRANRPLTPAIMLSLVITILFVHIAIYLVNTIGASTIDALVCRFSGSSFELELYSLGRPQHAVSKITS